MQESEYVRKIGGKEDAMGLSTWAKQARRLAAQHSDSLNAGIDKAAEHAKRTKPDKGGYIDKAAGAAKRAVSGR